MFLIRLLLRLKLSEVYPYSVQKAAGNKSSYDIFFAVVGGLSGWMGVL
jgi:hypothetical protein